MEDYVLFYCDDVESDDVYIFDMGTKAAMDALFTKLVTEGKEDGNFYLCRVIKSAEVVQSGDLNVVDHGDEE